MYAWDHINDAFSISSGTSISVSATYAAHDRVVVFVTYGSGSVLTETVSDGTNTYSFRERVSLGSQQYCLYECLDAAAGTYTLQFQISSAAPYLGVAAIVYSGLDNSAASAHASQQQVSPSSATDAISSGSLTPPSQPLGLIGITADDSGSATGLTAGTGFTSHGALSNWDSISGLVSLVEDKRLTSTAAMAATFTASGAGDMATFGIGIPEPSGGGGGSPTYPQIEHAIGRGSCRGIGMGMR